MGWSIAYEGERNREDIYRLSKYSPAGQDFSIVVAGDSKKGLVESINRVHEEFDVSYETYLWLDGTGHGRNGAPYDMRDLYDDMEHCKNMILELLEID